MAALIDIYLDDLEYRIPREQQVKIYRQYEVDGEKYLRNVFEENFGGPITTWGNVGWFVTSLLYHEQSRIKEIKAEDGALVIII